VLAVSSAVNGKYFVIVFVSAKIWQTCWCW